MVQEQQPKEGSVKIAERAEAAAKEYFDNVLLYANLQQAKEHLVNVIKKALRAEAIDVAILAALKEGSMKTNIIQNWVSDLGLRHQGVIVSAVRGCDTLPKEAAAKTLSRFFRGSVLNAHCGSVKGAKTYMAEPEDEIEFQRVAARFFQEWDSLPFHYVMHFVHAAEIVGYYREDWLGVLWKDFYLRACRKMHITPETKDELDARLNKDEASFFAEQKDQAR